MATNRRKIAILYDYNENWIGSTYYIQNLISALNNIPDEQKPLILVIAKSREEFDKLTKLTGYPFLDFRKLTLTERIVNNFAPRIPGLGAISRKVWSSYSTIDLLFPATQGVSFSACKNKLFWVADFQEHYLPEFFSKEEIDKRKAIQAKIVDEATHIVLSSESARNDLNEIYKGNKLQQYVLPFAVTHPPLPEISPETIREKYAIPQEYFICSNQFWKHKNHAVVLKTIALLKEQGKNIFVAFTGKIYDYRNPQYFDELKQLIDKLGIKENIGFLGFISRGDQLLLMKNAVAVIQPSLFEGWSTVVEDAKALKIKIIASAISVHKEQLTHYSGKCFFDPLDEQQLASCITTASQTSETIVYDYHRDIFNYGNAFSGIINTIAK